jgi:hypothetical protein
MAAANGCSFREMHFTLAERLSRRVNLKNLRNRTSSKALGTFHARELVQCESSAPDVLQTGGGGYLMHPKPPRKRLTYGY